MGKWTEGRLCLGLSPIIKSLKYQKYSPNILKNSLLISPISWVGVVETSFPHPCDPLLLQILLTGQRPHLPRETVSAGTRFY